MHFDENLQITKFVADFLFAFVYNVSYDVLLGEQESSGKIMTKYELFVLLGGIGLFLYGMTLM